MAWMVERCPRHELPGICVLLVPASARRDCRVLVVPPTAAGLSDALGGALLDDAVHATVNHLGYCVYLDEERVARSLPEHARAMVLATHLGWLERAWEVGLRGDVLLAGIDVDGNDTDVPLPLVLTARTAGVWCPVWP